MNGGTICASSLATLNWARIYAAQFHLEAVESMLWIADGKAAIESDATLSAAKYVGGIWAIWPAIGSLVPAVPA